MLDFVNLIINMKMLAFKRHKVMSKLVYFSNPKMKTNHDLNVMLRIIDSLESQYMKHPLYRYIESSVLLETSNIR